MSYIGKVDVGSDRYSVGSTLYGLCDTGASTVAKVVTLDDFTVLIRGVTVYVKFNNGNSAVNNVTLKVGTTDPINVIGNCTCNANEILAFTYEENATAPGNCWRTHTCGDVVSHGELEAALANIPRAVIFKGVLNNLPDANTSYSTYDNGDIVIVGTKEYIYKRGNSAAATDSYWTEFGDETAYALEANSASITVVNNWTGSSVTNGVLTLPVLTTTTTNVITPRS
jgi:hypothetical protein